VKRWNVAVEVKVTTSLFPGIALLYVLLGVVMVTTSGASARSLLLPVVSLALGGLVAGGLALRMPSSRFFGFGVGALLALLHTIVLLAAELWWVKIFSGLAAAGYVYSVVLLNSMPVRRYLLGEAA
jgi:hypothetical protein